MQPPGWILPYVGYTGVCADGKGMVFKPFTLGFAKFTLVKGR